MNTIFRGIAAAAVALGLAAGSAAAQSRVDAKKDWSIFEATSNGAKVCWIVSQPTKTRAVRGGKEVTVRRGDIFLMVAVRKADNVKNEVSYLSGYPFKKGSKVKVEVTSSRGSSNYNLFTDGENAWTSSPQEDDKLTKAYQGGREAIVTGTSSRGTTTIDTFSLAGFTAAIKSAQDRCK